MKPSFLQLRILALTFFGTVFLTFASHAQLEKSELKSFTKIVISPDIDLVLTRGEKEGITIEYSGVAREDIIFHVKGNTLSVYLQGARVIPNYETYWENEHKRKENVYKNAKVTARITYQTLAKLKVSGDSRVTCHSPIEGEKFKLKLQGENDVYLKYVNVGKFKVALYGENELEIGKGQVGEQRYKAIGDNRIKTRNLSSLNTTTFVIGESTIELNSSENLKVNAIGESDLSYRGGALLNKGFVVGENKINRIK